MRAASSRPRAGIAAAAPKPHARPTPATVKRTPRRASSAERLRFVARRRHQLRNPAAAATAPTHPSVSPTGWEFHTTAATTVTSTIWTDSASGPPASSCRRAARRTSAWTRGSSSAASAARSRDMALFGVITVGCATSRDRGRQDRAFLRHRGAFVRQPRLLPPSEDERFRYRSVHGLEQLAAGLPVGELLARRVHPARYHRG